MRSPDSDMIAQARMKTNVYKISGTIILFLGNWYLLSLLTFAIVPYSILLSQDGVANIYDRQVTVSFFSLLAQLTAS